MKKKANTGCKDNMKRYLTEVSKYRFCHFINFVSYISVRFVKKRASTSSGLSYIRIPLSQFPILTTGGSKLI